MAICGALQGIMITGIYARSLFAMPAYGSKSSVLPQRGNPAILRMIKIIARCLAFFALITDFQVNE